MASSAIHEGKTANDINAALHAPTRDGNAEHGQEQVNITLIGAGTIGLSFAALHLTANPNAHITIHDTRPDLSDYITRVLPTYLTTSPAVEANYTSRLTLSTSLPSAVANAHIVQEQGPENVAFKASLWPTVERHAPATALFWSSTSGIPASAQSAQMRDRGRVMVVHPFNPPHVMPLLEVVPSPAVPQALVERTLSYWRELGRAPVVLRKEVPGFVANRLAFALFREAIALVHAGVVGVEDLDAIVENSMGPRWAIAGPFKSYHAGGGEGGLEAFMRNIGGTVRESWAASEEIKVGPGGIEDGWEEGICKAAGKVYGVIDTEERDRLTRDVLKAVSDNKGHDHQEHRLADSE